MKLTSFLSPNVSNDFTDVYPHAKLYKGKHPPHSSEIKADHQWTEDERKTSTSLNYPSRNTYRRLIKSALNCDLVDVKKVYPLVGVNNVSWVGLVGVHKSFIHEVCEAGKVDMLKYFISKGEIVDIYDKNQNTPLTLAAAAGHVDIVKILVKHGSIDIKDKNGQSPIFHASKKGHAEIVRILADETDNVGDINRQGMTPLLCAARWGRVEVIKVLVKYEGGCELKQTDRDQNTALHLAVKWGKKDVVKFLLEKGASRTMKNKRGQTPKECTKKDDIKKLFK